MGVLRSLGVDVRLPPAGQCMRSGEFVVSAGGVRGNGEAIGLARFLEES
jgi:hypothetical protein